MVYCRTMASTYNKPDSPFIWIRYKDAEGRWKSRNSGYRQDNIGDRKQAELEAQRTKLAEMERQPVTHTRSGFAAWVVQWIDQKWGHLQTCTPKYYKRYTLRWLEYFDEVGITTPATVTREIVLGYLSWRADNGADRNTAIDEIKFFAMVMDEAKQRKFVTGDNPARGLDLSRLPQRHKEAWTDDEVALVGAKLAAQDEFGWLHVTFLFGLYQASRLRQCAVPLRSIDVARGLINYPDEIVKGRKGFSQPINPEFLPILKAIVEKRKALRHSTVCDIPGKGEVPPSVQWRKFLDTLNLQHLSHHGLRATFITRAALAGVPEAMTRRFVSHASQQVHEIYQRITAADVAPIFAMMSRR